MNDQDKEQNWVTAIIVTFAVLLAIGIAIAMAFSQGLRHSGTQAPAASSAVTQRAFSVGTLDMSYTGGVLTLTGQVPDEDAKHRILSRAQTVFGMNNVKDQITVVPGSADVWWRARPLDVFSRLRGQFSEFLLSLKGNSLSFKGQVASDDAKNAVIEWFRSSFADGVEIDSGGVEVDAGAAAPAYDPNVLLNEHVEFASGSADIPAAFEPQLKLIADALKDDGRSIRIIGHTDNTGDADSNRALSLKRAEAVRDDLVAQGVPADHLSAEGAGQDKPIASNDTEEGRQKNRRIEFVAQ